MEDKEGKPEASGKSAAEAKNDDKKKFEDAILVVATLITTLTYQALLNPPSTVYNQLGTEIEWRCLGKNPGRGLIKGMKECPAGLTFAFLFINTTIFLNSNLIVVLTLPGRHKLFNPFGSLLGLLTINLTVTYFILLMAFSYYTAYVAIPLCCVAFLVFAVLIKFRSASKQMLLRQLMEEETRGSVDNEGALKELETEIKEIIQIAEKGYIETTKEVESAILVVATLITTLTYQALLNPPSTLFKQGNQIDWGCLGKHLGRGLVKGMKECPAGLAFAFLFFNTSTFLNAIMLVAATLRGRRGFLLGTLIIFLMACYCILLMAFSYNTAYVAIPVCVLASLRCLSLLSVSAATNHDEDDSPDGIRSGSGGFLR